jgi:hypothetical protein
MLQSWSDVCGTRDYIFGTCKTCLFVIYLIMKNQPSPSPLYNAVVVVNIFACVIQLDQHKYAPMQHWKGGGGGGSCLSWKARSHMQSSSSFHNIWLDRSFPKKCNIFQYCMSFTVPFGWTRTQECMTCIFGIYRASSVVTFLECFK